ncbi:acyl-CoA thioester hydrolase/BAAT C-terminal domain-containing protein [Nocardioides lianchengensis]|uniref:BAAT / Acyl-CoA thioester hydrolase C terminal n=1 Tax=Nocardioides lianchengensis TaxID=1045774 RepID=A0A1G6P162_9ACTN|nr:acyl-CoA thioester hydrolase/BAAT C-terminal domain-containing protein [Nocardioides lianchengensis]NYG10948.1 dienelactone hydrolase [Nocardioides lianchengensis]SDC73236.1 BAAT / Acyl-CoA thioester hydrolase C terminal [Nocardioides lianchengensis]
MEEITAEPPGLLVRPGAARDVGTAVLLLAGSSGRVDEGRARVLAAAGATVWAIRWFGGPGQQPAPYDVPLELFAEALDRLRSEADRLAVVGTSFGAEAALLTASYDGPVDACVAFAPTSVVWTGYDGERATSHWTRAGLPLPCVPFVADWAPAEDPPAFRDHYARSLDAAPATVREAATIPVERIGGDLVLVAGGDDQVWPSSDHARAIAVRRAAHGLATTVVEHPVAGHRTVLPGEAVVRGGMSMRRGGTPMADQALGAAAWPHLVAALGLAPEATNPRRVTP